MNLSLSQAVNWSSTEVIRRNDRKPQIQHINFPQLPVTSAGSAADMILKDDAFSSIGVAVRHGRVSFDNIRRFVIYLIFCNFSKIFVIGVASLPRCRCRSSGDGAAA